MAYKNQQITCEGNVNTLNFRGQLTTTTTSASTLTLSIASPLHQEFKGTTAGQVLNLGDATQYSNGHEWWVYNESTAFISVVDGASTQLLNLAPNFKVKIVLESNSTTAGIWILGTLSVTSGGARLVALFASTANAVSNKFLDTENVASSDTLPAVAATSANLALITFTNTSTNASGTIEIRVNTTVGTPAASVTFTTVQTYTAAISVAVFAGDQLNCKIASGASNVGKPLVKIYSA